MILGPLGKNVINQQSLVLYRSMFKQLMARVKNKPYQAKFIDANVLKDYQSKQDVKQFKEVIEMLKNQPYNPSKVALTGQMLSEILKMALDKQSYDQFQKSFKMKYQKYIQNAFLIPQILTSISHIKERIFTLDYTVKKLNCDSYEKIPKEVENLAIKVSCYQKIISELSQFPKHSQNKMPQLLNNKKNQILSPTVQKQIENMYMTNNILNNISVNLEIFREKQIFFQPKQLKDMFLAYITNPLAKAISMTKNQTPENNKNKEFLVDKYIQSPNIKKSSSNSQQKWQWMRSLLSKIHKRQDLTYLECKQAFFQTTERHQITSLLKDLKLFKQYFFGLVHMNRKADDILYNIKNDNNKLKSYTPQTIFGKFEPLFDVALRVCQQITRLSIVLRQKGIYIPNNNDGAANIINQFKIVEDNIKGQTQKWYYQLALQLAKKLNLFENKEDFTYQNMARERKRFILKIEQMTKQLQKYTARTDQSLQSKTKDLRQQNLKIYHQSQLMEAQLRNIKQKGIKQIEQLTPANKQGEKPIIQFETVLQMFNKLIYLKNQKIKSAQNEANQSILSLQSKSLKQVITKLQLEIASLQSDLTNQKALFYKYKQQQKQQIYMCTDSFQQQINEMKQSHSKQKLYHKNTHESLQKQIDALVARKAKDKQLQLQGRIEDLQDRIIELQKQHVSIQLQLRQSLTEQKEILKASLIQQKRILQGKLIQLQKQLLQKETQHEKQMYLQQKKIAQISNERDRVDDGIKFLRNEYDKLDIQLKEVIQQNKKLKYNIEIQQLSIIKYEEIYKFNHPQSANILLNLQNKTNSFSSSSFYEQLNNQKHQEFSLSASFMNCQKCKILQLELQKSKQAQNFAGLQNYEEEISKPFKKRISKLLNEKQQIQKEKQQLQNDNCKLEIQIKKLRRESLKQS